jgi:predicted lipoprotein with Yx(FWY)xxD motif
MTRRSTQRIVSPRRSLVGGVCAVALAVSGVVVAAGTATAATDTLKSVNPPNYAGVLGTSASRTLYVLSTEKSAKLHCTKSCLSTWVPLEVKTAVTHVSIGSGVKGKIAFVTRTSVLKQVTYKGYPLYTYKGDTKANEVNGEAVVSEGGTWYLARAAAKTSSATEVRPLLQSASAAPYQSVLAASSNDSLYLLSVEVGAVIKCGAGCTSVWLPLLVTSSTTKIALGAGVKGKIGFVARSSTMDQVTFNSYPVYTYTGDSGPGQSNGEGIVADGGTWYLLHAGATTAATTSVAPSSGGGGGGWDRRPS